MVLQGESFELENVLSDFKMSCLSTAVLFVKNDETLNILITRIKLQKRMNNSHA